MRVGVNTGDVVVGSSREGSSFVTGDAVNVADRLQKAAEPGEVLAGERTVAAVARAFEFSRSARPSRRRERQAESSRPRSCGRSGRCRPRGVRGLRRVFVGRDSELELAARHVPARGGAVRAASRHDRRRAGRREVEARQRARGPAREGRAGAAESHREVPCVRRRYHLQAARRDGAGALRAARGRTGGGGRQRVSRAGRSSRSRSASTSHPSSTRSTHASVSMLAAVAFVEELASDASDRPPRRGHPLGRARPARPPGAARHAMCVLP